MAILVTGGAGFIGSHTCVEMLNAGYEVIVVDNLCNASEEAIRRVEKITGKNVTFYKADIRDKEALDQIFDKESVECVISQDLKQSENLLQSHLNIIRTILQVHLHFVMLCVTIM